MDEGNDFSFSAVNFGIMLGYVSHVIDFSVLAEGANAALSLSGSVLGFYPVRVLPSKTAIAPVNPTFLPKVGSKHIISLSYEYFYR